jgi:uncharacterized protein with FMN-binding domain
VSGFVVFTFVAYALHERFARPGPSADAPLPNAPAPTQSLPPLLPPTAGQMALAPTEAPAPPTAPPLPTEAPTLPPAPTEVPPTEAPLANSQYKDGQYNGQTVDAFYGLVQVQAVIQNGKIANVQFLEYPNDRRTSIRINNVAIPMLRSEAIQAQSADVDVISGATLTSEAFMMSLQSALQGARA